MAAIFRVFTPLFGKCCGTIQNGCPPSTSVIQTFCHPRPPPKSQTPSARAVATLLCSTVTCPSNQICVSKGQMAWWDNPLASGSRALSEHTKAVTVRYGTQIPCSNMPSTVCQLNMHVSYSSRVQPSKAILRFARKLVSFLVGFFP
jgi:hypothetical protein